MMDWQPIRTAPKDGTWVILHVPNGLEMSVSLGSYFAEEERDERGRFKGGEWTAADWDGMPTGFLKPTHWQPLPAPPAHPPADDKMETDHGLF